MSASTTTCPNCYSTALGAMSEARSLYGKVSAEEYERAISVAKAKLNNLRPYTFLQDISGYISVDGVVHMVYKGSCSVCGLSVLKTVTEQI